MQRITNNRLLINLTNPKLSSSEYVHLTDSEVFVRLKFCNAVGHTMLSDEEWLVVYLNENMYRVQYYYARFQLPPINLISNVVYTNPFAA